MVYTAYLEPDEPIADTSRLTVTISEDTEDEVSSTLDEVFSTVVVVSSTVVDVASPPYTNACTYSLPY